jgi:hypothetical protein
MRDSLCRGAANQDERYKSVDTVMRRTGVISVPSFSSAGLLCYVGIMEVAGSVNEIKMCAGNFCPMDPVDSQC